MTANQSSCMTLWPMMLHHHTKFGYRRSAAEEISSRGTFIGILNLFCDLDHNTANPIFSEDNPPFKMMYHQTKFNSKKISSSDNILKRHILIILSVTATLTLKAADQSFWKRIWLIMMHHRTTFGSKRFRDLEHIIWTNIHWHFEIFCDLDLEYNNPISL